MKPGPVIWLFSSILLLFAGCRNDDPHRSSSVYIIGSLHDPKTSISVDKCWRNGVEILSRPYPGFQNMVVSDDGDVYLEAVDQMVVDDSIVFVSKYWKNGQPVLLTGEEEAYAPAMAVSGDDVYVGGSGNFGGPPFAVYWKNRTEMVTLTDGTTPGRIIIMAVSDGVVYAAGYEGDVVKYWKGSQSVVLGDAHTIGVLGIAVANNNAYVLGAEVEDNGTRVMKYWKNGAEISLIPDAYQVYAIAAFGEDVYAVGDAGNGSVCWKNGVAMNITMDSNGNDYFNCIAISKKGDVYLAGAGIVDNHSIIKVWKNGVPYAAAGDAQGYPREIGLDF